jgi:hypothetical protein
MGKPYVIWLSYVYEKKGVWGKVMFTNWGKEVAVSLGGMNKSS